MPNERDATIEELDLIARAKDLTERLKQLNRYETDTYLIYGPYPEAVEVQLTMQEFIDFYEHAVHYCEFDGMPAQIHTGHVASIIAKKQDGLKGL